MPRANPKEAFVWQAAAGPERARLLGAIAIALSTGCLGILLGRWSVELTPGRPPGRTAALIEAVSKETQAKAVGPARRQGEAGEARPAPPSSADRPAPEAAAGPAPGPAAAARPASEQAEASATAAGEQSGSAPRAGQLVEVKPRPPTAPLPAANEAGQPAGDTSEQRPAIAPERRPAFGRASLRPPARDYQALRDDLLNR